MLKLLIVLATAAAATATNGAAAQQPAAESIAARTARYEQLYKDSGNATLLWLIAEAHAEAGQEEQAIAALGRVVGRGLGFVVTAESPLHRLRGKPRFDELAARLDREFLPVRNAHVVATVASPRLVPEGIAADPRSTRLFLGDMAGKRILLVRPGRRPRVFATTGNLRPLGMTVDQSRRLLWVAATTAFGKSDKPASALLSFDLATGRLKRSVTSPELQSINDVAIAPNGDAYVTDSLGGALFRLPRNASALERVTAANKMGYPNGVAVSGDGRWVYVAQGVALRRVDAASGEMTTVAQPPNLALLSIDGLYWHDGSLIGIQNGGNPGRVLRMRLSSEGTRIGSFEVLEAGNRDFDIPTTASVAGDRLYLIANSQLLRLGDDGAITEGPSLRPIKLLHIALTEIK